MITAPIINHLTYSKEPSRARLINTEYHIEVCAEKSQEIATVQNALLQTQAEMAVYNLQAMGSINNSAQEIVEEAREMNLKLADIDTTMAVGFDSLQRSNERGFDRLDQRLEQGFRQIDRTLFSGFSLVIHEMKETVNELNRQRIELHDIAQTLSRPYETKVVELLRKVDELMLLGELAEGRERVDNWKDALTCLYSITKNDVGASNCVAWFNIGWLRWQLDDDFGQAEEAFYNAQRYSARTKDRWHTKALRHLAEMQYKQQRFEEAWETTQRCLAVKREYDASFNAARYAAKTGRTEQMAGNLRECINIRPTTILTMFAEVDFKETSDVLFDLHRSFTTSEQQNLLQEIKRLEEVASLISESQQLSQLPSPPDFFEEFVAIKDLCEDIRRLSYFRAVEIKDAVNGLIQRATQTAKQDVSTALSEEKANLQYAVDSIRALGKKWESISHEIADEHEWKHLTEMPDRPDPPDGCGWCLFALGAYLLMIALVIIVAALLSHFGLQFASMTKNPGFFTALIAMLPFVVLGAYLCRPAFLWYRARKLHKIVEATTELRLNRQRQTALKEQQEMRLNTERELEHCQSKALSRISKLTQAQRVLSQLP
jgi:tetratricopeptide (TPR) repeat protein